MGKFLIQAPKDYHDNNAQRKADEHLAVLPLVAKYLLRPHRTPEDRRGEKSVDARACELVACILCADGADVGHLEIEDANADDRADESGNHLSSKGLTRRNLDVVCELQVVGEPDGVSASDISKRLEVVHGQGVTVNPRASNELGQDVERYLDTRHGFNDANWNDEHDAERQAVKHNARRGVRIPASNASDTEGNGTDQTQHVPPLGHFFVRLHQAIVHIENVVVFQRCLLAEAVKQGLEAHEDLVAVVENGIGQRRSVDAKEEHVNDNVARTKERRRVCGILVGIEVASVIDRTGDVVQFSGVVVDSVCVDGQVARVVDILVPESQDDPHGDECTDETIQGAEEGDHQGVGRIPQ